jgi:hypothetical protein
MLTSSELGIQGSNGEIVLAKKKKAAKKKTAKKKGPRKKGPRKKAAKKKKK